MIAPARPASRALFMQLTTMGFFACRGILRSAWQRRNIHLKNLTHGWISGVTRCGRISAMRFHITRPSFSLAARARLLPWKNSVPVGAGKRRKCGGSFRNTGMSFRCASCPAPMAVWFSIHSIPVRQPPCQRTVKLYVFWTKYVFWGRIRILATRTIRSSTA